MERLIDLAFFCRVVGFLTNFLVTASIEIFTGYAIILIVQVIRLFVAHS